MIVTLASDDRHLPHTIALIGQSPLDKALFDRAPQLRAVVFDNTKIKRFVPGFAAKTPFAAGIRRTIAWFDADPGRKQIDEATNNRWDKLVAAYETALAQARTRFAAG